MRYTTRQASDADYEFLYRLHVAAMRYLVAQVWGWDDARQEQFFADHFNPGPSRIIVVDGIDAGVIAVEWREDTAFVENIEILPEYQGGGVGGALLRDVIAAATVRGLPVTLQVLKINRARRLYERLGFTITGETTTHFLMRRETQGTMTNVW